ncbi:hypothetical protein [Pseudophaeobacter sp.]|uniref:hypothetical protein n=1 Tax=Pseudophaeobacter sp. TaxID=1971739 RepID=UPI00220D5F34|nr:hypothetical protein [Pseudophaeobacter sp.]UWS81253.1 hypothetical protein N1037_09680 [Phaeobacter sp. G2]
MFTKTGLFGVILLAALPAAAQSISQHFSKGSDSCYQRLYSASHLASHPVQKVEAIQLSHVTADSFSRPGTELALQLAVRLRGSSTWQTPVACTPRGSKLSCALECDGGRFDVVVKNAGSILITGGSDLYFYGCDGKPRILERLPDDKVFMLHRQPLASCRR